MDATNSDRNSNRLLPTLAATSFTLVLLPTLLGGYGFFIDEFYYIACSNRLALGYVDHPPLAPFLLRIVTALLGDSLLAIRFLPALSFGACVYLTGILARQLGASRYGQALAATCMMLAPIPLIFAGFFSMNPFSLLFWIIASLVLVELARCDDDRLWLLFGLVAGIALLNKHTFVLFAFGLTAGVLLTPMRRFLLHKRLWIGVMIAAIIFLPNVYWQWQHDWASFEFYRNADLHKNAHTPVLVVLLNQILFMNPASLPIWVAGVVFFLATKAGRPFRFLGWMFIVLFVSTLIAQKSRPDRIAGAFPIVLAGGATLWDSLRTRPRWRWSTYALPAFVVAGFLPLAPLALPILSPESLSHYAQKTGLVPTIESGSGKVSPLPQWFADRFGWEEFIAEVVAASDQLTVAERAKAMILAPSYGHAGAIELLGQTDDLPPVCSGQNSYYLWGPGDSDTAVLISIGYGPKMLGDLFEEVTEVGRSQCNYCTAWRSNLPIFLARKPKRPWPMTWERFKQFE